MPVPGFASEASLYRPTAHYRTAGRTAAVAHAAVLAQAPVLFNQDLYIPPPPWPLSIQDLYTVPPLCGGFVCGSDEVCTNWGCCHQSSVCYSTGAPICCRFDQVCTVSGCCNLANVNWDNNTCNVGCRPGETPCGTGCCPRGYPRCVGGMWCSAI
jgi:hypothetical protein